MAIQCWPNGHNTRNGDCDQEIPDDKPSTMRRFGWGWVLARDDGSPSGEGFFLACPHHRSDIDEPARKAILAARENANGPE